MTRRAIWWSGTAVLAGLAILTAAIPPWRLRQARTAAQKEGLLLQAPAGPSDPRLGRLLEKWRTAEDAMILPYLSVGIVRVIEGREAPGDRRRVTKWQGLDERRLAEWRTLSQTPRLGFTEQATHQDLFGSSEINGVRTGGQALLVAASLGRSPRENLRAAARLSRLLRAEYGLMTATKGAALGSECLQVAQRLDLAHETDAALGPPTGFRQALRLGLPRTLAATERKDPPIKLSEWLEDLNPFAPDARLLAISQWRRLWRELPADESDFKGADRVLNVRLPIIFEQEMIFQGARKGTRVNWFLAQMEIEGIRAIGRFEASRQGARKP